MGILRPATSLSVTGRRSASNSVFAKSKVIDRRRKHSHGYRAVHCRCGSEQNVRGDSLGTELQHLWQYGPKLWPISLASRSSTAPALLRFRRAEFTCTTLVRDLTIKIWPQKGTRYTNVSLKFQYVRRDITCKILSFDSEQR